MKRLPICQRLGAADELKLFRRCIRLLPALARRGAAPVDALAVAYNATFLFYSMPRRAFLFSPKQILKRYSLAEIAQLCEDRINGVESGFNKNYREELP